MSANRETLEEISSDLEMTPMIDVTFLLLIFFLCAARFKSYENKLQTFLPQKSGPSPTLLPDERLPTEVKLRHRGPGNDDVEIRFGQVVVADFEELAQRIAQRHDTMDKKETLALCIFGTDLVHWEYVVKAFDVAIGCGVENVQFGVATENQGIKLAR